MCMSNAQQLYDRCLQRLGFLSGTTTAYGMQVVSNAVAVRHRRAATLTGRSDSCIQSQQEWRWQVRGCGGARTLASGAFAAGNYVNARNHSTPRSKWQRFDAYKPALTMLAPGCLPKFPQICRSNLSRKPHSVLSSHCIILPPARTSDAARS